MAENSSREGRDGGAIVSGSRREAAVTSRVGRSTLGRSLTAVRGTHAAEQCDRRHHQAGCDRPLNKRWEMFIVFYTG